MKLTSKGRYGLKAMAFIATHDQKKEAIALRRIAQETQISEQYLEQIFAKLKKNGLVISQRGAQGGYRLSKSPQEITVGNILRALEGSLAPAGCVDEQAEFCVEQEDCMAFYVWQRIKTGIDELIDSITLQDVLAQNLAASSTSQKNKQEGYAVE